MIALLSELVFDDTIRYDTRLIHLRLLVCLFAYFPARWLGWGVILDGFGWARLGGIGS